VTSLERYGSYYGYRKKKREKGLGRSIGDGMERKIGSHRVGVYRERKIDRY